MLSAPVVADGGPPVKKEDFLREVSAVRCETIGACCRAEKLPLDQASCLAQVPVWHVEQMLEHAKAYSPAAAGACVRALRRELSTSCRASFFKLFELPACRIAVGADVPLGGDCIDDENCAPTSVGVTKCALNSKEPHGGVCAAQVEPKAGVPCRESESTYEGAPLHSPEFAICRLAPGLRCDRTTLTCAERNVEGGACTDGRDCMRGFRCAGGVCQSTTGKACTDDITMYELDCGRDMQCVQGRCALRGAAGATCNYPGQCLDPLTCYGQSLTCVPQDVSVYCRADHR